MPRSPEELDRIRLQTLTALTVIRTCHSDDDAVSVLQAAAFGQLVTRAELTQVIAAKFAHLDDAGRGCLVDELVDPTGPTDCAEFTLPIILLGLERAVELTNELPQPQDVDFWCEDVKLDLLVGLIGAVGAERALRYDGEALN
jgi:hypothetical protein